MNELLIFIRIIIVDIIYYSVLQFFNRMIVRFFLLIIDYCSGHVLTCKVGELMSKVID